MSDKKNINLDQYSSKKEYPKLEEIPKLVEKLTDYQAVEEAKRGRIPRFKIVDGQGKSYGCSYSYLVSWEYDPPSLITLTFSDRIFTLEGQHIGKIERFLMEEKVKELRVFNPQKHNPPAKGETTIESLTIT